MRTCKSEEEIKSWLDGKYMITLENSKRFVKDQLYEDSIVAESAILWHPVGSVLDHWNVRMIQRGRAEVNDNFFSLHGLTSVKYETFTIYDSPTRQLNYS